MRCVGLRHLLIAFVLIGGWACRSVETRTFSPHPTVEQAQLAALELALVARETGLRFPEAAHLIGVSRERGRQYVMEARVLMPESKVDEFFAGSPIQRRKLRRREYQFGLTEPSWVPTQPGGVLCAQAFVGTYALNLGVLDAIEDGRRQILIALMSS